MSRVDRFYKLVLKTELRVRLIHEFVENRQFVLSKLRVHLIHETVRAVGNLYGTRRIFYFSSGIRVFGVRVVNTRRHLGRKFRMTLGQDLD